jgi:small GTP-binding protein
MEREENFYLVRAVVVGNYAVGKTTFVNTFAAQEPYYESKATLLEDILYINMDNSHGKKSIYLEITDTAGQEKGNNIISTNTVRKRALSFLMFDLTDKNTFLVEGSISKGVVYWFNEYISRFGDSEHTIVLIGNKADLTEQRQVPEEDAKYWAKERNMLYFEISALDVAQVNHVVKSAIQAVCKKVSTELPGAFNTSKWENNGVRILGDQRKIDLSGIIDYDIE